MRKLLIGAIGVIILNSCSRGSDLDDSAIVDNSSISSDIKAKGVIGLDCSGWYKLYDKNWNLIVERHLQEGFVYSDTVKFFFDSSTNKGNQNANLKNITYIKAKNCKLTFTGGKYDGSPINRWKSDLNSSYILDLTGKEITTRLPRRQLFPSSIIPNTRHKLVYAENVFGVKGEFTCHLVEK